VFAPNLINCAGHLRLGSLELEAVSAEPSRTAFRRLVTEVSNYIESLPFPHRGAGSGYRFAHGEDRPTAYHVLLQVSDLLMSERLQTAWRRSLGIHTCSSWSGYYALCPRHFERVVPGVRVAASSLGTCLQREPRSPGILRAKCRRAGRLRSYTVLRISLCAMPSSRCSERRLTFGE
jgi:hypothetical protein